MRFKLFGALIRIARTSKDIRIAVDILDMFNDGNPDQIKRRQGLCKIRLPILATQSAADVPAGRDNPESCRKMIIEQDLELLSPRVKFAARVGYAPHLHPADPQLVSANVCNSPFPQSKSNNWAPALERRRLGELGSRVFGQRLTGTVEKMEVAVIEAKRHLIANATSRIAFQRC